MHLDRHIKFARLSNSVVLGSAHEKRCSIKVLSINLHSLFLSIVVASIWLKHRHAVYVFIRLIGTLSVFEYVEHHVGPLDNKLTHIQSTILK